MGVGQINDCCRLHNKFLQKMRKPILQACKGLRSTICVFYMKIENIYFVQQRIYHCHLVIMSANLSFQLLINPLNDTTAFHCDNGLCKCIILKRLFSEDVFTVICYV